MVKCALRAIKAAIELFFIYKVELPLCCSDTKILKLMQKSISRMDTLSQFDLIYMTKVLKDKTEFEHALLRYNRQIERRAYLEKLMEAYQLECGLLDD